MAEDRAKAIFVTGTDTGVGKTIISSAIAASLRRRGENVGVMKPFESGCLPSPAGLVPRDSLYLAAASSCGDDINLINPYRFKNPLAPAVAAEMESVQIELGRVADAFDAISRKHKYLIVEGVGGLFVPLKDKFTVADLISMLSIRALIVSRCSLGAINHTLLTVKCASDARIEVSGVIMNQTSPADDPASQTNPRAIEKLIGRPLLATFPHLKLKGKSADVVKTMADTIDAQLDVRAIFE